MIANKKLTVSIIIPAFNEERVLAQCLDSIHNQIEMPDEVIVVNNNSSDSTALIAESYPFVKLVNEKKQGLIAARNKGFSVASGEVYARIDADTVLSESWVKQLKEDFLRMADVDAISGPGAVYEVALKGKFPLIFFSKIYFRSARKFYNQEILWGSNMAMRKSMWHQIKNLACEDNNLVHEDVDLSILIQKMGGKIFYDKNLKVYIHGFRFNSPAKLIKYYKMQKSTRTYHETNKLVSGSHK
jgi:glycosyltransferase involved in cell wall biosynthesis